MGTATADPASRTFLGHGLAARALGVEWQRPNSAGRVPPSPEHPRFAIPEDYGVVAFAFPRSPLAVKSAAFEHAWHGAVRAPNGCEDVPFDTLQDLIMEPTSQSFAFVVGARGGVTEFGHVVTEWKAAFSSDPLIVGSGSFQRTD